ncbi:MAG: DUF2089 family protein [Clostridia bacterium]
MLKIPTKCPICGKNTYATVVKCGSCGTTMSNKFEFSKFERLTEKEAEFVLAFIDCEGSIKDMEKTLNVSYPTVKSRLAEIKCKLGLSVKKTDSKLDLLKKIGEGQLDPEDVIKILKENK